MIFRFLKDFRGSDPDFDMVLTHCLSIDASKRGLKICILRKIQNVRWGVYESAKNR